MNVDEYLKTRELPGFLLYDHYTSEVLTYMTEDTDESKKADFKIPYQIISHSDFYAALAAAYLNGQKNP